MAVLTSDLIETTKRHLYSGQKPSMNKLAIPAISSATSLTFVNELNDIQSGAYVQVDLEVFYVWEVNELARTATVEPAQLGSVTSAHDAGDIALVNPKFFDHAILAALNDCLNSLSSPSAGLYQSKTVNLTYIANGGGYDLAAVTDLIDIEDIRLHRGDTSSKDWPRVNAWDVGRNVNSTDFPSGLALFLLDPAEVGSTIRVRYRSGFGTLTTLADNVITTTGLPATALDIPPLGAAIRLVHPREVKRNFTEAQGDSRRSGEVGPGAVAGSVNALERDYYRRINEEASRLSQQNPPQGYVPQPSNYTVNRAWARNGL